MSSKIEIPRSTLIRSMNIEDVEDRFKAIHELRGLLAAPVVERHPVAWVEVIDSQNGPYNFHGQERLAEGRHSLYVAPPELAELQANISQLTAEIERLRREEKNDAIAYKATIEKQAELRTEIKQLKGGQGEPVTIDWPDYHGEGMGCGLEDRGITDRYEACEYGFNEAVERCAELFANEGALYNHPVQQPAPVSVVELISKLESVLSLFAPADLSGMRILIDARACLDKVKELNP